MSHGLDATPISNQWVNLRVLEALSRQKAMTTVSGEESRVTRHKAQGKANDCLKIDGIIWYHSIVDLPLDSPAPL